MPDLITPQALAEFEARARETLSPPFAPTDSILVSRDVLLDLAATIRALMTERDEAKEDLNTAEGRAEDALRLYDGAREDIDSLRADLANATAERDEARASETRAWNQYAQKVAELAEAQAKIAELEAQLETERDLSGYTDED